jgi:5-methylcytosine-specific restriction endonuclease McrA
MTRELQLPLDAFDPSREPPCRGEPRLNMFRLLCYRCPRARKAAGRLYCMQYGKRVSARAKYQLPGWKRLRDRILLRDGHACTLCGGAGPDLAVHHLDGDPTRDDPGNLVSVCGSCHAALHATIRRRRR